MLFRARFCLFRSITPGSWPFSRLTGLLAWLDPHTFVNTFTCTYIRATSAGSYGIGNIIVTAYGLGSYAYRIIQPHHPSTARLGPSQHTAWIQLTNTRTDYNSPAHGSRSDQLRPPLPQPVQHSFQPAAPARSSSPTARPGIRPQLGTARSYSHGITFTIRLQQ